MLQQGLWPSALNMVSHGELAYGRQQVWEHGWECWRQAVKKAGTPEALALQVCVVCYYVQDF